MANKTFKGKDMKYKLKPKYHFSPEKNWMNDPNGLTFFKEKYHMFYQHNPHADVWGDIHWGHVVSTDLVHWQQCPIALSPSLDKGEVHCYSGCTVIDNGIPTIFYTSIGINDRSPEFGAQQWRAKSYDDLMMWEKYSNNPAIDNSIHKGEIITFWRDPFIWQEGNIWFAIMSGTHNHTNGCILIYRSPDLENWEFLNILYETEKFKLLECPNMIKIGEDYVMIYSPVDKLHYHIGRITDDFRFDTKTTGILDGGSGRLGYYSPNTYMNAPDNRRILFGWISDFARKDEKSISGWSGIQSLPRVMTIQSNELCIAPAEECSLLRKSHSDYSENAKSNSTTLLQKGNSFEIVLEANVVEDSAIILTVLESKDKKEKTTISYCGKNNELTIDRSASSLYENVVKTAVTQTVPLRKDGELKLDIFVDCSVVEVFANDQYTLTARMYPSLEDAENNKIEFKGTITVKKLELWTMEELYNNFN
ncbi:MAG: glycoside hydrolase family 32 protein [Oscillospiraceae bacterium]|nr:glycoside hydrolase family 32 protein [Oscillospiraceae bacterium]